MKKRPDARTACSNFNQRRDLLTESFGRRSFADWQCATKVRGRAVKAVSRALHPEMAAIEALRGLVDAIVLTANQGGEALQIELRGNLAAMLGPLYKRRGRPNPTTSRCKLWWLRGHATR